MLPVEQPFKTYTGLDGKPLDNGYVYFGQPNQDPANVSKRVTVYWDAAGTLPADQPLRTVNGYIMNNGTPANVFFDGAYSELVRDSKMRQVFYARTSDDFSIAALVVGLAKAFGSSLIGFIQSGIGAVSRTVQDKLRERVSVFDYMTPEQIADVQACSFEIDVAPAWEAASKAVFLAGGGIVEIPPGGYLFGTSSTDPNAHYAYVTPRDGVSFIGAGAGVSVVLIKAGENARFAGTTGPNVIGTKQAEPLKNCVFKGFTVEWADGNLLTAADTARNNASIVSVNGGYNIVCEDIETRKTPGNQCIFLPCPSDAGQGKIRLVRCTAVDCGSGLPGNYNADHSSFYCNGTHLRYDNLRGTAQNLVNGALYELHGSDALAVGCSSDHYALGFWIASNFGPIKGVKVFGDTHTNCAGAFSISAQDYAVDDVEVASSDFIQAAGLTLPAVPFFINGNTVVSCSSLDVHDCKFVGAGYATARLMQHYKIAKLRFANNECSDFGAYGLLGAGLDIGGGRVAKRLVITGNHFQDVANAVYYNMPGLACQYLNISGNTFDRSIADAAAPVTLAFTSSAGLVGPNNYSPNYSTKLAGTPNGAKVYDYTDGAWLPTLAGGTSAGAGTYTVQAGQYTKSGNRVTFHLTLKWTAHSGTGQMLVSLPVPPLSSIAAQGAVAFGSEGIAYSAGKYPGGLVVPATGKIHLYEFQSGGVAGPLNVAASGSLFLSGSYTCDA